MRILKKILISILFILLVASIAMYFYLNSTAPKYEGVMEIVGLHDEVEVLYDNFGIPHIYAANSNDAYKALGYVHAQDRLLQMELIRRVSSGTLSEVFGSKLLETDKYFRTLGIRQVAQRNADQYFSKKEEWQEKVYAYLEGVNDFIDHGNTPIDFTVLGIEKRHFDVVDVLGVLGYMGLGFSNAIKEDDVWTRIEKQMSNEALKYWMPESTLPQKTNDIGGLLDKDASDMLSMLNIPIWYGSNGWAVSGEKSVSGYPILANDTHIGISQPSVWYEAHIEYPGHSFYGNYLATVPFGMIGHNDSLGWGLTIFPFDNMDLYQEVYHPSDSSKVKYKGEWVNLKEREEKIKVKGEADIVHTVRSSVHGPLVNHVAASVMRSEPVSLWWSYYDTLNNTLRTLHDLNYVDNINDFESAVKEIDFLGLNVLYADKAGNIAHWGTGSIPNRPPHVNSYQLLDGTTDVDEPDGYYPFSTNPRSVNPESGYVASANNAPDTIDGFIIPGYYPPNNRISRIRKLLESEEKLSTYDMKDIQLDDVSDNFKSLSSNIVASIDTEDAAMDEMLDSLERWDGGFDVDRVGPVIFSKVLYYLSKYALVDDIGETNFEQMQRSYLYKGGLYRMIRDANSSLWDNKHTDVKESKTQIINKAVEDTYRALVAQLGSDISKWKWGNVHTITHKHPLDAAPILGKYFNVGPFSVSGGNDVPNKMMYTMDDDGLYQVTSAPALRIILDFAYPRYSENINPTGTSANIMSPHYDDQAQMFVDGVYRGQLMDKEDIKKVGTLLKLIPN